VVRSLSAFAVRVTYAFVQILAIGAEVTAAAIYFSIWFPAVPQWVWVVAASLGLIAVNGLRVGNFGEFEYWFAIIKVITIVAFILIGLGLIFGLALHIPSDSQISSPTVAFFPMA